MDLPPDVKARRAVEDKAIKLGRERNRLEGRLAQIIEEAVELMSEAERNAITIERLAELIDISRPTLYRWRDATAILRANRAEAADERGA
jgi:AcrR family transcriptional regulator